MALTQGEDFRGGKMAEIKSRQGLMQIADHREGKPMRYYRFTLEQANHRRPLIRDI